MSAEKRPAALISFDIEEFDIPTEYGAEVGKEDLFEVSKKGTERILDTLAAEPGTKATFFITAAFAQKYPELVRNMAECGHEIASHGLEHSSFKLDDLSESRRILSDIGGTRVAGFRMARLAHVEKRAILAAGYDYDSSLNPVYLPGRYNHFRSPLGAYREPCGLWQVPVSAVPLARFPLFWLSFKNLPLWVYETGVLLSMKATGFFSLYTHPWEYNETAREARWKIPGYITRHAGAEQAERLALLLRFLGKRATFQTISDYLKDAPTAEKTKKAE